MSRNAASSFLGQLGSALLLCRLSAWPFSRRFWQVVCRTICIHLNTTISSTIQQKG